MSNDALRARFEALLKPESRCKFLDAYNRPTAVYVENHIRGMWEGFQLGHAVGMEDAAAVCDAKAAEFETSVATAVIDLYSTKLIQHLAEAIRAKAKGEKP